MKKIFRIEAYCNVGFIVPQYEYRSASDFYLSKEKAEEKLKELKKLTKSELIDLLDGDPEDTELTIEEYNVID